ncbi:hypothetical protein ECC02_009621 [Trypanosoma cruzi]|uniref:Uncharacterized protein n=1 Tax=Trypanosoma cruzi TaxID=5693 RepID=A0A7J6XU49_TRYCR|nr:hypothetical protein ECC02_009621 [Trypanosoma cruzi]
MCRNILDERSLLQIGPGNFNPPLACQQGVAALTSGKRFRRRQRRAGHRSEGGTAPPIQGFLVIRKARAGLSKSGQESHRACARCRHSGTDVRVNTRNRVLSRPTSACHAVCAPSFSSWKSFHHGRFTAVREPTCHALAQFCGRDRAMTVSASAVTLRGTPRCHGENVKPAVRPRSASESGTVQISSVTSSCTSSGPRRSDSIAERESVAAGTRVGDWDAAARRGTGKCLRQCSVAGRPARQEHARLPAAVR